MWKDESRHCPCIVLNRMRNLTEDPCILAGIRTRFLLDVVLLQFLGVGGCVKLSPLGTSATAWPIPPVSDDDECGAVGGITGRGNRSTWRKPASVQLCQP
jgi:hypothetical protein